MLSDFDKYAAAGGANKAVVREFLVTANGSGQINVSLTQGSVPFVDGNPTISGLELLTT